MPKRYFVVVVEHDHGSVDATDVETAIELMLAGRGNEDVKVTAVATGEGLHGQLVEKASPNDVGGPRDL